jgi:hypothetical protein
MIRTMLIGLLAACVLVVWRYEHRKGLRMTMRPGEIRAIMRDKPPQPWPYYVCSILGIAVVLFLIFS